jgi:DNA mismatch repair protein MutS2
VTPVAGTPPSLQRVASPDTLAELEFERALDLVAQYAVGELGARAVRGRHPRADAAWVRAEIALVSELMVASGDRERLTPRAVPDLSEVLEHLETPGSVLEGTALHLLRDAVEAMREVAGQLRALEDDAPLVAALRANVPDVSLGSAIGAAVEPDGRVKDEASPGVRRARRRVRETRERLVASLEVVLRGLPPNATGEGTVTLRGGRYVIPVRREGRSAVRGIVHGESGSGSTLFVEPVDAVDLGNALQESEAEEQREVLAVLRALTERARPEAPSIRDGWGMCISADELYARARYAAEVEAVPPGIADAGGPLRIDRGVHPLLHAESGEVVSFDLDLDTGRHTLLVSGPNAGGKTVLLKAVGLFSCLVQSGIVPPLGEGSTLPIFTDVLTDIGDHQSIEASLSTFSAHVARLKQVLETAGNTSLVLLDELGGGTDPLEGAALAGAVLLALNDRRAVTLATTHLSQLKDLAARTHGVVNANLAFDAETLSPTYRFEVGRPGRSYGLAIARRLGLSDDVLAQADALTPEEARSLEAALAEVERREARLREIESETAALNARLERDRASLERRNAELSERLADLETRERESERSGREHARRFLLDARKRVEEALALARAAVTEATAKEARRLVEKGVSTEADALRQLEELAAKGWRVKGGSQPRGKANVVPAASEQPVRDRSPSVGADVETPSSELDLRGLRADEAEALVISRLDQAVMADLAVMRIIHGKGTGALRAAVGEVLRADSRVEAFRLAPPEQGGSGVTIVEFGR